MFDLGWSEMGIVLLVALLILGPKELPKLARDLGRWVGKARALSREFQRSLEDMAREAELDDVKKQLDAAGRELRHPQIGKRIEKAVDPDGELRSAFEVDDRRRRSEDVAADDAVDRRPSGDSAGRARRAGEGEEAAAGADADDGPGERQPAPHAAER